MRRICAQHRVSEDPVTSGPDDGPEQSIARVRVDLAVRHLDRDFDYLIPEDLRGDIVPGSRVRVRFAGRLKDAYVIAVSNKADVADPRPLDRIVDRVPPLTPESLELVERTAERFVGSFWDVVRAAVPTRHARAEKAIMESSRQFGQSLAGADIPRPTPDLWSAYEWPSDLDLAGERRAPVRLVWSSAPSTDFAQELVDLTLQVRRRNQGVVVVVPDAADVETVRDRLVEVLGRDDVATLTAEQGPERRYREFLRARTGRARTVIGTRNAVFAPVADCGAVILWDDGDDVYREPHAPYWDAREVAALRSHLSGCDLLVGAPARSVATQWWCESGWARSVEPKRPSWWRVQAMDDTEIARDPAARQARIPTAAWRVAREALGVGPVLVQVLRRGYVPVLACQDCRSPALCPKSDCGGGLHATSGHAAASCVRCGALAGAWTCGYCGGRRLRAVAVGAGRTAEELGRAFPGVAVVWSQADRMVRSVPAEPALVVATPGAEPVADGGYAAVVLLDARVQPTSLSGPEQQVRRWFSAARLVSVDSPVCVVADPSSVAVQALVRYDSRWFAQREITERASVGLPPLTRVAELSGPAVGVDAFVDSLQVTHRVLGPVPIIDDSGDRRVRTFVLTPRSLGNTLTNQLTSVLRKASTGAESKAASKTMREVRVRMDPRDM